MARASRGFAMRKHTSDLNSFSNITFMNLWMIAKILWNHLHVCILCTASTTLHSIYKIPFYNFACLAHYKKNSVHYVSSIWSLCLCLRLHSLFFPWAKAVHFYWPCFSTAWLHFLLIGKEWLLTTIAKKHRRTRKESLGIVVMIRSLM